MINYPDHYGVMTTPASRAVPIGILEGRVWACDNEAFSMVFDESRFFAYLEKLVPYRSVCLFVSVPDVLCNAIATLCKWRSHPWASRINQMGFPVAFVAQDGQELFSFPPEDQWQALFIGGSTQWKMGQAADSCIVLAQQMGKTIHVGRVNSVKRIHHFMMRKVDSCDGTGPIYEPDTYQRIITSAFQQYVMPLFAVSGGDCVG